MKQHKCTMADIAQYCGVSQSTVSLVLNQKAGKSIPQETVTKVLEAARELHYDKPLRKCQVSRKVMVLVSDLTNPYYSFIVNELEKAAEPYDLRLFCCSTYHQKKKEVDFLDMAVEGLYQGVIFLYPPDAPDYAEQINCIVPTLAICDRNSNCNVDLIELNNFRAGCIAAEHLLTLGHQKIAVLSSDPERNFSRANRLAGIQDKAREWGLPQPLPVFLPKTEEIENGISKNSNYNIGYALAQREAFREGTYTAFIAINDMIAMGVIDGFFALGIHFPEDYSLVGFDDLLYTGLSRISLTTVDHHPDLLAQAAIDLLLHRTQAPRDTSLLSATRFTVTCSPQLVVRSSTARLPAHSDKKE